MTAFFTSVQNFFRSLWETVQLLGGCLKSILDFFVNIFNFLYEVFASVPIYIYICLTLVIAILILYKVLGR